MACVSVGTCCKLLCAQVHNAFSPEMLCADMRKRACITGTPHANMSWSNMRPPEASFAKINVYRAAELQARDYSAAQYMR